jgi:MerR family transcriptional regulator, thiopeptide resistance regulator
MHKITELAGKFGLSRSTLLYYDKIGLLTPSGRTEANYRSYSATDLQRLEMICSFRQAGLAIKDIQSILASKSDETGEVLHRRFKELGEEIAALRNQQRLLAQLLKAKAEGVPAGPVDKDTWVAMLEAAGMDDEAKNRWHAEFERRAPDAHHDFLLSLGISEPEAIKIREWSRSICPAENRG